MALARILFAASVFVYLLAFPAGAQQKTGDWKYGLEVYGWLPDISSTLSNGAESEISQTDILENLEFALQGNIFATKGNWTVFADTVLLQLGAYDDADSSQSFETSTSQSIDDSVSESLSFSGRLGLVNLNVNANARLDIEGDVGIQLDTLLDVSADVRLRSAISTFGAGYTFYKHGNTTLTAIGGVRYLYLDVETDIDVQVELEGELDADVEGEVSGEIEVEVETPFGSGRATREGGTEFSRELSQNFSQSLEQQVSFDASDRNWDGIIGIQGATKLDEKWTLLYYADVGTGDSEYTAQARVGLSYALNNFDLTFGYRYLHYELDSPVLDALDVSGPYVGALFRF
ncbi:hypothetical protein [Ruegeria profundi]|uniref:Porin domain-containing protein n=1 Tax=Ruegeria profundi TaxID=1685378 RepID=A0A0X3TU27_9RHOB|nr:hypothetical protein [Ruegeria profundi]KUJ79234.1 hypothetical protein AVO44_08325 [Ruegeria profundi]